ncbi:MAG: hypothetical protein WC703_10710 [Candidatus Neomarinimicrobiota bacterium]
MIIKRFLYCGLVALSLFSFASAQSKFGLGVILGEPTGISGKMWMGQKTALDAALAWSSGNNDAVHVHVDYLWHNFSLIKAPSGKLPFYYGIGGKITLADETRVGVRVPLGIDWILAGPPIDVFLEIVPALDIVPDTDFGIDAGLGVRYNF